MSLFDKTNQHRTAFKNSAEFFPATIGESLSSAWDLVAGTETSLSFHNMEYDMFERYRGQIEELTGERLYNPLDHQAEFTAEAPGGFELQMEQWFKDVERLREKNPGVPQITFDRLIQDITAERKRLRDQRAEVASRETSAGNTIAGFIGGAGAALSDPLVLGSMAFGAPAASGVLRTVLTEAALGAGSEVAVQGAVQATRDRLGEGVDFAQAAENVLMAGLGGGILAGAIRGGITGTRALLRRIRELPPSARTPEVKAAEQVLKRQAEMQDNNPFGPSLAGQTEHARRLDAAMRNAVRPLRETLRSTTAVGRALPLDQNLDLPVIRAQETVEQYAERVRIERPDLFNQVDAVAAETSEVSQRITAIRAELERAPSGDREAGAKLEQLRARVSDLEKQGRSKTVQRKLKRARRQLETAERNPDAQAALHRRALQKERETLEARSKELSRTSKALRKEVKKAVKQTPRHPVATEGPTIRAIDQAAFTKVDADLAKAAARMAREAVEQSDPVATLSRDLPATAVGRGEPLAVDPEIERAIKDEAAIDAELAREAEQNPERIIEIEDEETGAISTKTIREHLEDLEEDRKLLDEFEKCIREALS